MLLIFILFSVRTVIPLAAETKSTRPDDNPWADCEEPLGSEADTELTS